jgi:transmembrane sensor
MSAAAVAPACGADSDDEAIAWLVRLRLGTAGPGAEQRLAAWRGADARNEAAWRRLQDLQCGLALPADCGLEPDQARAVLRATRGRPLALQGRRLCLAAMAAGVALAVRQSWQASPAEALAHWTTGPARLGRWTLADGSVLHANANTALALRTGGAAPHLALLRGEIAWLGAARGAVVETPHLRVHTDASCALLVRADAQGGCAAARDGAARVAPAGRHGATQPLPPGATLRAEAGALHPWDWQGVDPWAFTEGVLSVRQTPLAVFAAELARHHARAIGCDPALAALRVSGTFQLGDLDGALALLARLLPLQVRHGWGGVRLAALEG